VQESIRDFLGITELKHELKHELVRVDKKLEKQISRVETKLGDLNEERVREKVAEKQGKPYAERVLLSSINDLVKVMPLASVGARKPDTKQRILQCGC
jgi:hypothetical protein